MIEGIIKKIRALKQKNKTLFIAIDGRGGSGKTTLAGKLQYILQKSTIVHLDDIVYPMEGADRMRLLNQVIIPLENNHIAKYQKYDYKTQKLSDEWNEILPGGIVIIEGVSPLHSDLRDHFTYTIWVECPPEIGFQRGVARELVLQGKDVTENWLKYMKEEEQYIQEQHPQKIANIIVDYKDVEKEQM